MPTWMNAGRAQYHGLTVSLRRAYSNGLSFDFNYTWSHSIDYASAAESGAGKQGAAIQNIFNVKEFRGSSDFDIRHNITANYLFELPIGKNKPLFRNASRWLDGIIGGWQLSTVMRYRTRFPTTVAANPGNFPNPSLALTGPVTFGEFQQAPPPREMQFALRFEF